MFGCCGLGFLCAVVLFGAWLAIRHKKDHRTWRKRPELDRYDLAMVAIALLFGCIVTVVALRSMEIKKINSLLQLSSNLRPLLNSPSTDAFQPDLSPIASQINRQQAYFITPAQATLSPDMSSAAVMVTPDSSLHVSTPQVPKSFGRNSKKGVSLVSSDVFSNGELTTDQFLQELGNALPRVKTQPPAYG